MISGSATPQGTARYAARFGEAAAHGFFRAAQGRMVSSLGLGTYLGAADEQTGAAYEAAVEAAVRGGVNVLDAAINYRGQHSERNIGAALRRLFEAGAAARDELLVCTKAGFLTPGAVPDGLRREDVAAGMHSMTPEFLEDQIERSRANLGLETIDVFYLHNPETQLMDISREMFDAAILAAFTKLEVLVSAGKIGQYGTATWNGYRLKEGSPERLSLKRLIELAREVAGEDHNFRYVQLPLNLAMPEAFTWPHDVEAGAAQNVLEVAVRAGQTVVASASILQSKLARGLPEELGRKLGAEASDAQRAIQFTRSTPGVTTALVGMSSVAHVEENLGVARMAPLRLERYLELFERGR